MVGGKTSIRQNAQAHVRRGPSHHKSSYCRLSCSCPNWLLPSRHIDDLTLHVCTLMYMHDICVYGCVPHCLHATCSVCMHAVSARLGIAFSAASFCVHLIRSCCMCPRSCHACRPRMSIVMHMLRLCAETALLMLLVGEPVEAWLQHACTICAFVDQISMHKMYIQCHDKHAS